jgi:RNA polymerase sigma factor (sigma-70 family)
VTKANAPQMETLAQELAPDLLSYFLRRVDDPADAADLLGDTLLVLCRRPKSIPTDPREARLWAFGIARKTLSGRRRTHRRRTALQERLRNELTLDHASGPPESSARLHAALAALDELDREIIRLLHWEGFSQAEIGTILHKPAGTIRSRYTRARAVLRVQLQGTHRREAELEC